MLNSVGANKTSARGSAVSLCSLSLMVLLSLTLVDCVSLKTPSPVAITLKSTSATVATGSTAPFSAAVTGTSNASVTWTVSGQGCSGTACGTISSRSSFAVYIAPPLAPSPAIVNIIATSVADSSQSASASVTIVPRVAVTVAPTNPTVPTGTMQRFSGSVTAESNTAVSWSVSGVGCGGAACGTISASGLYSAPMVVPSPAVVFVKATSVADPTKSAMVNVTVVSSGGNSGGNSGGSNMVMPVLPTLPQAQVDASMPDTTDYTVVQVNANGNLQSAINNASCNPTGTIIKIQADATFEGPYILPVKACAPGKWVILRSDAPDTNLPALNQRITPSFERYVPVILAKWSGRPSIEVASGASNYRLMFLEAKVDAEVYNSTHASLIAIGDGSSAQNTIASQPKNIIVDRVLMRGSDSPPVDLYRGIDLECQYCAVANSWIDQVHVRGFDSQGIVGWNSTGPWLIDNNYIEAAAENIMLCGSDSHIPGALPSDITITHNYVFKPLNWKWPSQTTGEAGPNWSIKNLLEMKCGIRVLIEGNVFQNVWLGQSDQLGEAIKINPANQKNAPWTGVSDLTFRLNEVINAEGGFGGPACSTGPNPTLGNQRDLFENNLSIATGGASGRRILVTGTSNGNTCGMPDVYFNHNTILAASDFALTMITMESIVPAGVVPLQRFAFHNNIMAYDSRWGVAASSMECFVSGVHQPCWTPDAWWSDLIFDTTTATCDNKSFGPHAVACPVGEINGVGFVNSAASDYHLAPNSIGKYAGTDGKDVGADMDALNAAIAGVVGP